MDETDKAMTLRMPAPLRREAELVARVDEVSVNELVRTALRDHIAARRKDGAFRNRLARIIAENQEILDRLA
jgi:hypothetical protein